MEVKPPQKRIKHAWQKTPIIIRSILLGFIISTAGVLSWTLIGSLIPLPWSFILMLGILWLYISFLSGKWKPAQNMSFRKENFRLVKLSGKSWWLSLTASVLIVLIEQSGLVITFRLIEFPAETFAREYAFLKQVPAWAGWLYIIMISLVAGVAEETGFRGYMQVPLEKKYSRAISISIVSVIFVLVHLHQAWSGPILVHIFFISVLFGTIASYSGSLIPGILAHFIMDICNFSFWWSDLGGQFDRQAISVSGADIHFILWLTVFAVTLISFVFIMRGLGALNKAAPISI